MVKVLTFKYYTMYPLLKKVTDYLLARNCHAAAWSWLVRAYWFRPEVCCFLFYGATFKYNNKKVKRVWDGGDCC
jgi:hypothetical protein